MACSTRLIKITSCISSYYNLPVPGGCPLLNSAIESDHGFPELHEKASEAYNETFFYKIDY
jgi:hypothetical protein